MSERISNKQIENHVLAFQDKLTQSCNDLDLIYPELEKFANGRNDLSKLVVGISLDGDIGIEFWSHDGTFNRSLQEAITSIDIDFAKKYDSYISFEYLTDFIEGMYFRII